MLENLMSYEVESNGEKIMVDIEQTEKGIVINIVGRTPDIVVNGETIFSKYDRDEYKFIPIHLRPFIEKYLGNYDNSIEEKEEEIHAYLEIEGREFLCGIPKNKAKGKVIYLRDWLIDYELVEDGIGVKVENGKEKLEKLLNEIKSKGYSLELSHGGNDYDNWYDLIVPMNNVEENTILECIKLWNTYNEEITSKYLNGRY